MKILILTQLTLITQIFYAQAIPNCDKNSYCQACDETNTNQCALCFNFGKPGSHFSVKAGDDNSSTICNGDYPTQRQVENCQIYMAASPSAVNSESSALTSCCNCAICDGQSFLTFDANTEEESCTDTPLANLVNISCGEIDNCQQTVCIRNTSGNDFVYCNLCETEYYPSTFDIYNRPTVCAKLQDSAYAGISNCYQYTNTGASVTCYMCDNGYVAQYDLTACIAIVPVDSRDYIKDQTTGFTKFCRRVTSTSTATTSPSYCYECWPGYYFTEGFICRLASNMISFSALGFFALFIY